MKYVALATDANPNYSTWAPLAVRVWGLLGYEAILVVHSDGWEAPHGKIVLEELVHTKTRIFGCPTLPPHGVATTMRCARLVAAAPLCLQPTDIIVTSDIDLVPVSRTWFANPPAMGHFRIGGAWCADNPGRVFLPGVSAVGRLGMCFVSMAVSAWRAWFPEIVPGDLVQSLRNLIQTPDAIDVPDLDELKLRRLLAANLEPRWPGHARFVPGTGQPGYAGHAGECGYDTIECLLPQVPDLRPFVELVPKCFPELTTWASSYVAKLREVGTL